MDTLFGTPIFLEPMRDGAAFGGFASGGGERLDGDAPGASGDGMRDDDASDSNTARTVARWSAALCNLPEIRRERVSQLAGEIRSGAYSVSNRQTAESMLEDLQRGEGCRE